MPDENKPTPAANDEPAKTAETEGQGVGASQIPASTQPLVLVSLESPGGSPRGTK